VPFPIVAAILVVVLVIAALVFTLRTVHWGATAEERSRPMPGDAYFSGPARRSVVMTRAITIHAPPETVWPWLAQLGRGAGWYSYDLLDNGARRSANHIVAWIPPPDTGDATPIGYLRRIRPGSELTWWVDDAPFLGSLARLVVDIRLTGDGKRSRLVIRMSGDATGGIPIVTLSLFRFIDSVMARRQLLGIRDRVERYGTRTSDPAHPESGGRDQYQYYEVVYASGERAGVPGKERAEICHRAAVEAGLAIDVRDTRKRESVD